jgi:glycosyltransferase involved in cell wall biosynthesis
MSLVDNLETSPAGVSVVICCYNSAARLPETLRHLARQDLANSILWEVIVVVEEGSTDSTADVANRVWQEQGVPTTLRVLVEPIPGKSAKLELGFAKARYDTLVIVDDDNWLNPNYLSRACSLMLKHPEVGALGGKFTAAFEEDPPDWFPQFQNAFAIGPQGDSSGDITDYKHHVAGAGMVVRKSAYEELKLRNFRFLLSGGRKGKLLPGEDLELCYALVLAGYRIWYDENLRLSHFMPKGRLTMDQLRNLLRSSQASWPITDCYQAVLGGRGASAVRGYLRRMRVHSKWVSKSAAKLLLGRQSFMLFRFEFLGWWYSLCCLPALRRAFKMHYKDITKLKRNPTMVR